VRAVDVECELERPESGYVISDYHPHQEYAQEVAREVEGWPRTSPRLPPTITTPAPPAEEPASDPNPEAEDKATLDPAKTEADDDGLSAGQPPQESPKAEDGLEEKAAPDSPKTGGTDCSTAKPRSLLQQTLRDAVDETFPNGWGHLPTSTIIEQASKHPRVKDLKRELGYDTWQRALGRRVD
jgi:hypothetical protein